eukprot:gene8022-10850_t
MAMAGPWPPGVCWMRRAQPRPSAAHLMTQPPATVFLIDVDNTLLDNDRVIADLRAHLEENFGAESSARYWDALEA